MSGIFDSTASRFLRPDDVARIQRNQRRINVQRAMRMARSTALIGAVVFLLIWAYGRTQSDARFAVKTIDVSGVVHTSRADLGAVTSAYAGANLFRIDIARVQAAIRALPWVSRVEVEKKLPDTLRIRIVERTPAALVRVGNELRYADESGVPFAALSPSVGDPDLPLIVAGDPADLKRCTEFVRDLRQRDPLLYARISEVRPLPPNAFALFDRDLGTTVYAKGDDLSEKWRTLYAVADAERFGRAAIRYADLRFADRIILKPVHPIAASAATIVPTHSAEITN